MEAFRIRGPVNIVTAAAQDLTTEFGDSIKVSSPIPVEFPLMAREPLRHDGLVDVLISIAESVAARAIFEGLKRAIERIRSDKKEVEVTECTPAPQSSSPSGVSNPRTDVPNDTQ